MAQVYRLRGALTCLAEGIRLLERARSARHLFEKQEAREKRRLLDFLVSNCSWKDGQLMAEFRRPFDLPADTAARAANVAPLKGSDQRKKQFWLEGRESRQPRTPPELFA